MEITAVILAGGQARRMGYADKGLLKVAGHPLIEYVIKRIKPQVNHIIINTNRSIEAYRGFGYPIIEDFDNSQRGPLIGIVSVLRQSRANYLLILPCDAPLLPIDLVKQLSTEFLKKQVDLCIAHDGHRIQPLFSLMRRSLLTHIEDCLDHQHYGVEKCLLASNHAIVHFNNDDAFSNLNEPQHIRLLEQRWLKSGD